MIRVEIKEIEIGEVEIREVNHVVHGDALNRFLLLLKVNVS